MSPELIKIIENNKINNINKEKSSIFSLGIITFRMVSKLTIE